MSAGLGEPGDEWSRTVADEILAERAADGDTVAFEAIIRRHGPLVRAYVARIVGSRGGGRRRRAGGVLHRVDEAARAARPRGGQAVADAHRR